MSSCSPLVENHWFSTSRYWLLPLYTLFRFTFDEILFFFFLLLEKTTFWEMFSEKYSLLCV